MKTSVESLVLGVLQNTKFVIEIPQRGPVRDLIEKLNQYEICKRTGRLADSEGIQLQFGNREEALELANRLFGNLI